MLRPPVAAEHATGGFLTRAIATPGSRRKLTNKMTPMPFEYPSAETDDALMARYAHGDARAAQVLAARLTPNVYAHAMRVMGNAAEAEDICQEAMLRLWKIAPQWRAGDAKVSTWLYRVTANLCTDRLRRRQSVNLETIPEPTDDAPGAEEGLQAKARASALHAALQTLPERQRQAIVLRHLEGLGNTEIATIMELGTRAVESLLARGKRGLATALNARKDELGYKDD